MVHFVGLVEIWGR